MPDRVARPFPIVIEVELLDRLSEPVREGRAKSVSAIVRAALEDYDFSSVVVVRSSQLQVSVRLPAEVRRNLRKVSRAKHTSVGQLVRAAVEAYLPKLEARPAPAKKKRRPAKARSIGGGRKKRLRKGPAKPAGRVSRTGSRGKL